MQHFLKPAAGAARATIVSAELLQQLLVRVDHALAALNARFGRISFAPFTCDLETGIRRSAWHFSWHFSSSKKPLASSPARGFLEAPGL
jgi:hypothetical protein